MKVKLVLAAVRERLSEAKQSDQRMLSFVAEDKPAAFQQSSLSVWAFGFCGYGVPDWLGQVSKQQCQDDKGVSRECQHDFEQCCGRGKMWPIHPQL